MNKQLELLLRHCALCHVTDGIVYYSLSPFDGGLSLPRVFPELPRRFAEGSPKRGKMSEEDYIDNYELWLMIGVDPQMKFHLELRAGTELLDLTTMTMVNATVPAIEEWLMSANLSLKAIPEHVKQYLKDLQKK